MSENVQRILNLFYLCVAILVLFFAVQLHFQPQLAFNSIAHRFQHPFDVRLRYAIGHIDPRFGISESEVKKLTEEAVQIWHQGLGKQVFVYDPDAKLKINLVYDERQAKIEARQKAEQHISANKAKHQKNLQELQQQKVMIQQQVEQLQVLQQQYQVERQHYHQLTEYVQQTGQAQAMQQMNHLRWRLENLSQEIKVLHQQHQKTVEEYNHQVNVVNAFKDQANAKIDQYKQQFAPTEFQQGVFTGDRIDIFTFESRDELRVVLAHELGHGLHIDHNDDPEALMYPVYYGQNIENFKLKPADIALYQNRPSIFTRIEPH